jgi:hypothetical protein
MFLNGKFARVSVNSTVFAGPFKWSLSFKRDRLDTTNFESAALGVNVYSEGLTGVMDTTFSMDGYVDDAAPNFLYPAAQVTVSLLFRKSVALGYTATADILEYSTNTAVRDKIGFTANFQTNGSVLPAS